MCPEGDRSIWNYVWRAKVPLKMRITAWKAASGALATDQNKLYRHIGTTDCCRVCVREREGSYHALVACPQARLVWQRMRELWPLPTDDVLLDNGEEWLLHVIIRFVIWSFYLYGEFGNFAMMLCMAR